MLNIPMIVFREIIIFGIVYVMVVIFEKVKSLIVRLVIKHNSNKDS